jgi:hypothetical protein
LPSLYNYTFNEVTNTYNFSTKNNIEYKIIFIVDDTLDSISDIAIENVYQVIIEKISDAKEPFDSTVSRTIEDIIISFFANVQNALIYVCSEEDEKAELRFNLFDRWYRNSTLTETVTKVDNVVNCESNGTNYLIYTSLLYHNKNANLDCILKAYKSIEDVLNDK